MKSINMHISKAIHNMAPPLLHTYKRLPCTIFNRLFALIYTCAILALFYHHLLSLRHGATSAAVTISLLIADFILAFMWVTAAAFRFRPIVRHVFPENLERVLEEKDYPAMDIFICTADPYKEPPMDVVNTALSLMAYDYPPEKISVYVSDDGGSELTLFAFMEAAKFAKVWVPFCRDNNIMDRCPEIYFSSDGQGEFGKIKKMYDDMKTTVENVMKSGEISANYINDESEFQTFNKFRVSGFTRQHHHAIIQVLTEGAKERDETGKLMPNLIYVSREKNKSFPHHFKAGALNVLLRVSGVMTNAPVILTQDCDMYSNDPQTPQKALCFFLDPSIQSRLGYVQFPQRFCGLNKDDIYGGEFLRLFIANAVGMDGLQGANYVGSGCFFRRRAFFGGPTLMVPPEIPELSPDHVVHNPITAQPILELAQHVAGCNYEHKTSWGYKTGFRYGSLVEDFFTGYHLKCEGWRAVYYHPRRSAFLGDNPITLIDAVGQTKRWTIGLLEVVFSKYNPMGFGSKSMGPLMGLCYAHYSFWPFWSIPITVYSFLPQIALLHAFQIFPKATDPWLLLYMFLFVGAYGEDCYEFMLFGSTLKRWWNDQRIWVVRGLSPFLFGLVEYVGIARQGFNVTTKVQDGQQSKRYHLGLVEFGAHSAMFVPFTTASIVSLLALVSGTVQVVKTGKWEELFGQMMMAGFGVLNGWPVYEAMVVRRDGGRMAAQTSITAVILALTLCVGPCMLTLV